jgi:hypothetical protein
MLECSKRMGNMEKGLWIAIAQPVQLEELRMSDLQADE